MPSRTALRLSLRVVFYKDKDDWIAHCLEFDLAGDGRTQLLAFDGLTKAIAIQLEKSLEHDNLSNLFSPADGRIFEMFAAGHDVVEGTLEVVGVIERLRSASPMITGVDAREYADSGSPMVLA